LFARRKFSRGRLVPIRHGVHQTSLSRHLVHLVRAVDQIRHVVAEIAHRRERIDVSRRRLLSSSLLLGEWDARKQIFFHARTRFHARHLALRERALHHVLVAVPDFLRRFADFSREFLRGR
jgi:hypothetical protein